MSSIISRRFSLPGGRAVKAWITGLASVSLVAGGLASTDVSVSAALAATQCNNINDAAASTVTCDVTVVNTLNLATGAASSTLTLASTICSPPGLNCNASGPTTTGSTQLVTSITQCNGSGNAGGSLVRCTVNVTNNIVGDTTATPATVNQCNGSGGAGGTTVCVPFPASTTGADVTQCNGSATGGGNYAGGPAVNCTVSPGSTTAAALRVTINQCNGSATGGGSSVVCSAGIANHVTPASGPGTGPGSIPGGLPGSGTSGIPGLGSSGISGAGVSATGSHPVVVNGRPFAARGPGDESQVSLGVSSPSNTGGAALAP